MGRELVRFFSKSASIKCQRTEKEQNRELYVHKISPQMPYINGEVFSNIRVSLRLGTDCCGFLN